MNESERDARRLMERPIDHYIMVTRNRNVMSNRWVFARIRISVGAVLGVHRAGCSPDQIITGSPSLAREDIADAFVFQVQHADVCNESHGGCQVWE